MPSCEQSKMARKLSGEGYQVEVDGHDHWRVCDGRGRFLAVFPKTSANWRWKDKLSTDMRRRERQYAEQDEERSHGDALLRK